MDDVDDDDDDDELELVLHTVEEQVEEEDYNGEQVHDTVEGEEVVLVLDTIEELEVGEHYDKSLEVEDEHNVVQERVHHITVEQKVELVQHIIEVKGLQHDDEV